MQINDFKNFSDMVLTLSDDKKCREYLENILWNGIPVCPQCAVQNKDHYKLKTKGEFNGLYKCKDCKQRFTVTIGTIFEKSHVSLRKWFIAIYLFTSHKKGISSLQLHRDIGVTQKTAWFMLQRIRHKLGFENNLAEAPATNIIEMDETFVGGKNKNRHKDKKVKNSQGRSFKDKTPIFGIMQRGGKVKTIVVKNTKAESIHPNIYKFVKTSSEIMTDEWLAYRGLKGYKHQIVNHGIGQYADGYVHTNTIEGFWPWIKRSIVGVYHVTSSKHLQMYANEATFRYNTRQLTDKERLVHALSIPHTPIKYKQLIAK